MYGSKLLLWAVSNLLIELSISHMHYDVWDMCNSLRVFAEHHPITLSLIILDCVLLSVLLHACTVHVLLKIRHENNNIA